MKVSDGPVSLICFTRTGAGLCKELLSRLQKDGICSRGYIKGHVGRECPESPGNGAGLTVVGEPLEAWAGEKFKTEAGLIFIGAAGIAVRAVAKWVQDKFHDPAVVVMDEKGQFAIPILSGHAGGANALACRIAGYVGAVPVITTATDVQGKFAADVFARERGLWLSDVRLAKEISAAVLEEKEIGFFSEFPVMGKLPKGCFWTAAPDRERLFGQPIDPGKEPGFGQPIDPGKEPGFGQLIDPGKEPGFGQLISSGKGPEFCQGRDSGFRIGISLGTGKTEEKERRGEEKTLYLIPKIVTLGIGCRKGIEKEKLKQQVLSCLNGQGISPQAVCQVATIDRKKGEAALIALCREMGWPLLDFSPEELRSLEGDYSHSDFVEETVGVDNVCERAAVLGSGGARLILKKQRLDGIALAAAAAGWKLVL